MASVDPYLLNGSERLSSLLQLTRADDVASRVERGVEVGRALAKRVLALQVAIAHLALGRELARLVNLATYKNMRYGY